MVKDEDNGFYDLLDVRSIDGVFRTAQSQFTRWVESNDTHISKFIESLPSNFFKLTDSLIVARTRKMIEDDVDFVKFPRKQKPENLYITPSAIGNFKSFADLLDALPPKLSAYKPAMYIKHIKQDVLFDEAQRDKALVKMVYILLLKRLESSWSSFFDTIKKIRQYHLDVLAVSTAYTSNQSAQIVEDKMIDELFEEDELEVDFSIGKRGIKIQDIEKSGQLNVFIADLKEDIASLDKLVDNLSLFEKTITHECSLEKEYQSTDTKLQKLIEILHDKQTKANKKVIIFSAYTDTARYIYDQLTCRGFKKMALVTGSYACSSDKEGASKHYEHILQAFAPYTKLFLEKKWKTFEGTSYDDWLVWLKENDTQVHALIQNPVDILITTDVLSEGQNLQDADMVINYDIHWNPVRVIQRMGRIDRIGSPNDEIFGVNFWPSRDINDYLNLQSRIEQRMATMKIVGSEIDNTFTDELKKISEDEALEQKQKAKMLKQMQTSWDDIEVSDSSLGFNDLSLETFRQDLFEELKRKKDEYIQMPKGLFTGFMKETMPKNQELIALLKNRKNHQYELIYIDKNGNKVLQNIKEVLEFLHANKEKPRDDDGLLDIDSGKQEAIEPLHEMLKLWANPLKQEKSNSLLKGLMQGSKSALEQTKKSSTIEEEFDIDSYDLIIWFVVR
jgi:superfamily II DNA/RNA helicase